MTEQSTPTPTQLKWCTPSEARMAWLLNDAGMEGADRLRYAKIIVAAGWKSPAEVADLVRVAAKGTWSKGYVHGYVVGSEEGATGVLVESVAPNPYNEPTPAVS